MFWTQFGMNIFIYMAQRDQYWKAYKDYCREKIFPICGQKKHGEKDVELEIRKRALRRTHETIHRRGFQELEANKITPLNQFPL